MPDDHGLKRFTRICAGCQESRVFDVVHVVSEFQLVPKRIVGRRMYGGGFDVPGRSLATCEHCGSGMLVTWLPDRAGHTILRSQPDEPPFTEHDTEYLPPDIAEDLLEACSCYSAGAYRGAALLSRRAIENSATSAGAPGSRSLEGKIDWLFDQHHLSDRWKAEAHVIRDVGNTAAHRTRVVDQEHARAILKAARDIAVVLVGRPPSSSKPNPTREERQREAYRNFLA